jgi:hypothetical protein
MKEANMLRSAAQILANRLPPGWQCRPRPPRGRRQVETLWEISSPDGVRAGLEVEVKASLLPRDVAQVRAQVAGTPAEDILVVARFLSPATRDRLLESELNYLDLSGNVRLVLARPGLFVETQGAVTDPAPGNLPGRTLKGPKAGRVVRALCDLPVPMSVSSLAASAPVDVSYASRLVEWLAREALVERRPRGAIENVDRARLIRRWATDYAVLRSNDAHGYLDPRGLDNFERRVLSDALTRYAATGSLAANHLAPTAATRLAMIYVDDVEAAARTLALRPADTGANVMLLEPYDDVVFERTWESGGLRCVAPSQMAVDLLTSPGRGPAEGEAVLETMGS